MSITFSCVTPDEQKCPWDADTGYEQISREVCRRRSSRLSAPPARTIAFARRLQIYQRFPTGNEMINWQISDRLVEK